MRVVARLVLSGAGVTTVTSRFSPPTRIMTMRFGRNGPERGEHLAEYPIRLRRSLLSLVCLAGEALARRRLDGHRRDEGGDPGADGPSGTDE